MSTNRTIFFESAPYNSLVFCWAGVTFAHPHRDVFCANEDPTIVSVDTEEWGDYFSHIEPTKQNVYDVLEDAAGGGKDFSHLGLPCIYDVIEEEFQRAIKLGENY